MGTVKEPPNTVRCVLVFKQPFPQNIYPQLLDETFAEDKSDVKAFLKRLSKFLQHLALGAREAEELEGARGGSASTSQALRCPLRRRRACPARPVTL